jgi:protein PsiE
MILSIGDRIVTIVEGIGLIIILAATLVAGLQHIQIMFQAGRVSIMDLLLLFIYLEIVTMVGIYWRSGKLPVRMPIYIAIVALSRFLMLDTKELDSMQVLGMAGAILLLALAVLVVRFGHTRFPYEYPEGSHEDAEPRRGDSSLS